VHKFSCILYNIIYVYLLGTFLYLYFIGKFLRLGSYVKSAYMRVYAVDVVIWPLGGYIL